MSGRYDWRQWKENAPRDVLWTAREVEEWCRQMAEDCRQQDIRELVRETLEAELAAATPTPSSPDHAPQEAGNG